MTEKDLLDLGFEKILVDDEESDNGYDYYYYKLKLTPTFALESRDSNEIEDGIWTITSFDIEELNFEKIEKLKNFIEVFKSNLIVE